LLILVSVDLLYAVLFWRALKSLKQNINVLGGNLR
jgi:hypothetical protein